MTRRQAILTAVLALLETIRQAAGYTTDAGALVTTGEVLDLGKDDPAHAITVALGSSPAAKPLRALAIVISGLTRASLDEPGVATEELLGDIRKAMETADRSLGGTVKTIDVGDIEPFPRDPGSTVVGMTITYVATYADGWGQFAA